MDEPKRQEPMGFTDFVAALAVVFTGLALMVMVLVVLTTKEGETAFRLSLAIVQTVLLTAILLRLGRR